MANISHDWQFEEDDTVGVVTKLGDIRIGLISEVYGDESDSSSEEEDDDDERKDDGKLKQGEVRVECYPTGKEIKTSANKTLLLDRSLLMGEVVYRRSQPNRVGVVRNVSVSVDVLLLPACDYVLRNVTDDRIAFVNKYDDGNTSSYIAYENWIGILLSFSDKLRLKTAEGYECWLIDSSETAGELYDSSVKRVEDTSYNTRQWYVGEPVKCTSKALENVEWLPDRKPPEPILRKTTTLSKLKFIVQEVKTESITVRWLTAVAGDGANTSVNPPSTIIKGENMDQVRKLNNFEYQLAQIGDRLTVDVTPDDVILPYAQWKQQLRNELLNVSTSYDDERGKKSSPNISVNSGEPPTKSCKTDYCQSTDDDTGVPSAVSTDSIKSRMSSGSWVDETEECVSSKPVPNTSASTPKNRLHFGLVSRRWNRYATPSAKRSKKPRKKHSEHAIVSPLSRRPNVGEQAISEIIYVQSRMEIMWQNGELETDVPSRELAYASNDLDDHIFVPGNFVLLKDDGDKTWPEHGYGVVERVDNVGRVAVVSWFEICTEKFTPSIDSPRAEGENFAAKFIRKEDVSVYELIMHHDFDYPPGVLAMIMSNDASSKVGLVLYTDTSGRIVVRLCDGRIKNVNPHEVCRVFGDDFYDDNFDGDESGDSDYKPSESGSWSTVDSDDSSTEDGDETDSVDTVGEELEKIDTSFADVKDSSGLLESLYDTLEGIRCNILFLRRIEAEIGIRRALAAALVEMYTIMKRVSRRVFGRDLGTHRYGSDLSNCVRLMRKWLKALSEKDIEQEDNEMVHPAKNMATENDRTDENSLTLERRLDDGLAKLCRVEEDLKKMLNENGTVSSSNTAGDVGWVSSVKKTLRACLRQILQQATGNLKSAFSPARAGANEEEKLKQMAKHLLQRELERGSADGDPHGQGHGGSEDGASSNENAESHIDFLANAFRSIMLEDGPLRCFETNPKQSGSLAIIDLAAFAALMISRTIAEQLLYMSITGWRSENTTEWPCETEATKANVERVKANMERAKEKEEEKMQKPPEVQNENQKEEQATDEELIFEMPKENENGEESDSNYVEAVDYIDSSADHFQLLEQAPVDHSYANEQFSPSTTQPRFMKAVRMEMKLLQSSLPAGVFVKAYENRMDLYSCMLIGPNGTPYTDGLFFFDVHLKLTYPVDPPEFFFKSFSTEQLNPNLYQEGKVCVSLLGTWSGKDSEVWNPGSNLLQVLVSIQGLILNDEPYYNEAGYESRRGNFECVEKSRRYNELALIRTIESLWKISERPPSGFEEDVRRHYAKKGRELIATVEKWIDGETCSFPLQPVSQGFALSAKRQLAKFAQALTKMGF